MDGLTNSVPFTQELPVATVCFFHGFSLTKCCLVPSAYQNLTLVVSDEKILTLINVFAMVLESTDKQCCSARRGTK